MKPPTSTWTRLALWPLSLLYRGVGAVHRAAYRNGWRRVERSPVPVISVGNLSVGGTGKTPIVARICTLLDEEGLRTAVVSRGYGRRGTGVTIVSRGDGHGPLVEVACAGDEPHLLASLLPRSAVVVASRRAEGARLAAAELGAEVVVADDAYQHHGLARQVDLLVIDATAPTDGGWLLPAGALREPLSASRRASAFLLSRCDRVGGTEQTEALFQRYNPSAPFFHAAARAVGVILPDGSQVDPGALAGKPVAGFCGIGKPELFEEDLRKLGIQVRSFAAFPDHHWFTDVDVAGISRAARSAGAALWITTEKDYVRLSAAQRQNHPICRLRIEVDVREDRPFRSFLMKGLHTEAEA